MWRDPATPEDHAFKNRPEIDALLGTIVEPDGKHIGAQDLETRDAVDGVTHGSPEWIDLDGRLTRLQEVPVVLKLLTMDLRPRFNQSLLRARQTASKTLDRVESEDR